MRKLITGTFIDEITYDIPSSNWTSEQWKRDLDHMKEIGMDTLVFIRGGLEDRSIFPSKVLKTSYEDDFASLILEEASKRKMDVYFGLYMSDIIWNNGDAVREVQKNKLFIDEVWDRYGDMPSFRGWYIPHETSCDELNITDVMRGISELCKEKSPEKDVLISPYFKTKVTFPGESVFTPERHYEEWDKLFDKIGKNVDICAFQDGSAPMDTMTEYFEMTAKLCKKYNIRHWINTETFERDVRRMYYPIPFSILKRKLEAHQKYAEKIITFEFSHFLSPQSIYPSARNLNHLYRQYYQV